MARRRFLIAYDIANERRLRRVITVMESYGQRLQYSVFLCDLSGLELSLWRAAITQVIHLDEDSVVVIDLGLQDRPAAMEVIGVRRVLPGRGPVVV